MYYVCVSVYCKCNYIRTSPVCIRVVTYFLPQEPEEGVAGGFRNYARGTIREETDNI